MVWTPSRIAGKILTTGIASSEETEEVIDQVIVPVDNTFQGCTYTQGYWRTHNSLFSKGKGKGKVPPRKGDPTWSKVGGPSADFLNSGESYYNVLWSPTRGEEWIILARQYIAAELNALSGTTSVDVVVGEGLMEEATMLLEAYFGDPTTDKDDGWDNPADADRALEIAETLDAYNNGDIGPGH